MISIFQLYATIVSGLSVLMNGLLLVLSANKSIDAMQELRYFLSNVSVASLVFSICNFLIQPQMVIRGSMSIRVPHGFAQHWPDFIVKTLAGVAVTAHMYTVLSFPIFFVYRLVILTNNVAWGHYFSKRNMVFTFIIVFIMSSIEGAFFYAANVDYESLFERLNRSSTALDQFKEVQTNHLQVLYTTTQSSMMGSNGGQLGANGQMQTVNDIAIQEAAKNLQKRITLFGDDYSRNPLVILFLVVALVGHLLAYVVVLLCAQLMLRTLRRKSGQLSFQARMSHEVLVHAIFAEAFVPLTFTVPILANSILCFVYTDSLVWQEYLPEYLIGVVPLLTPIISLLFIKPYRHAALNCLTFGARERKQAAERKKKSQEQEDNEQAREILQMNVLDPNN